jgi:hypothetical protein
MLRSRKKSLSSTDGDDNGKGNKGPNSDRVLMSSPSSSLHPEQIIPTWLLWTIVFFFIFLGFASEHYQQSRAADHHHEGGDAGGHNKQRTSRITLDHADNENNISKRNDIGSSSADRSLLTAEDDEELEYDNGQRYHVIFSTDCSPYQHWQRFVKWANSNELKLILKSGSLIFFWFEFLLSFL